MPPRSILTAAVFALTALWQSAALGEQLVTTLAPARVSISSSYNGGTVVLFGAIEKGAQSARPYDVTVTTLGPPQDVVTRRKAQIAGIWVNEASREFRAIPSFLAVLKNLPEDKSGREGANEARSVLGATVDKGRPGGPGDAFVDNLISLRVADGLFVYRPSGVVFISPTVFRAEIPLPDNASIGTYKVDVAVSSGGSAVADQASSFSVVKVGIEEFVAEAATRNSLLYGLGVMLLALFTGWLASVIFRRD